MEPPPEEVADLFDHLKNNLIDLRLRYKNYRQLYCAGSHTANLLDQFGGLLFVHIMEAMEADLVLRVCRMTDPATTRSYENQTLERLVMALRAQDEKLPEQLQIPPLLERIKETCKPFRTLRHKVYAHRDWGGRHSPLPSTTVKDLQIALLWIEAVLNHVEYHYLGSETKYQDFDCRGNGDGSTLVSSLTTLARLLDKERGSIS